MRRITMGLLVLAGVACSPSQQAAETPLSHIGWVWIAPGEYVRELDPSAVTAPNENGDIDFYVREVSDWVADHEARVTVSYGYFMSATHVTVGQWRAFVEDTGYVTVVEQEQTGYVVDAEGTWVQGAHTWDDPPWALADDQPVVQVSWFDAAAYAEWLSGQIGVDVRLPTLEEWAHAMSGLPDEAWREFNCADGSSPYEWRHGHHDDGHPYVNPVTAFPAWNGLRDPIGNVWSWLNTPIDEIRVGSYEASPVAPDNVSFGTGMTMRGGAYVARASHCHPMAPMGHPAVDGAQDIGFRLVMDLGT